MPALQRTLVTSNNRNLSKSLVNFQKFHSHFSRQCRDKRHSQHLQSLVDFKKFSKKSNRISRAKISRLATIATSPKLVRVFKKINRASSVNIVTSDTRNISKAWSTSNKFQLHFSRQYRDQRHSEHLESLVDFEEKFNRIFRANIVTTDTPNIYKA